MPSPALRHLLLHNRLFPCKRVSSHCHRVIIRVRGDLATLDAQLPAVGHLQTQESQSRLVRFKPTNQQVRAWERLGHFWPLPKPRMLMAGTRLSGHSCGYCVFGTLAHPSPSRASMVWHALGTCQGLREPSDLLTCRHRLVILFRRHLFRVLQDPIQLSDHLRIRLHTNSQSHFRQSRALNP